MVSLAPVIVFRAQDEILPDLLDWYRLECAKRGSPQRHLHAIDDARAAVFEWQQHNRTQVPQSATYECPMMQ